jgi:hypothetical protein
MLAKPPDPKVLQERRDAYLQKLQALREKSLSTDGGPSIVTGHTSLKNANIREFFPKEEPHSEQKTEPADSAPPFHDHEQVPEETASIPESPVPDHTEPDIVNQTLDVDTEEDLPLPAAESLTPSQDETAIQTESAEEKPAEDLVEGPEIQGVSEEILSKEDLIEQKIRQFEEELAMPCPICGLGKVLSDTTEKGKTYYHCSDENCRLISWGKPYNMACPVCKNPFLIEAPEPDGQIGLKCPRATCMYRKKNALSVLSGEEAAPEKRKKVAVVRKKRKKGVRRVVRRKS